VRLAALVLVLVSVAAGPDVGGLATLEAQVTGNGSVTSDPPGIDCPASCSEQFDTGTRVVLAARPRANASFLGWGGACTGSALTCTLTLDGNKTVSALFTPAPTPIVSIGNARVTESSVATVTATLAPTTRHVVTVRYATADGTATADDYAPVTGTLTFPAGADTATATIRTKDDTLDEPDETFFVDLSNAVNAEIARARGVLTIVDDDLPVIGARIAAAWTVRPTFTRVKRLVVTHAPAGTVVEVRCRGAGCPFNHRLTGLRLTSLFRTAKLKPGTVITVRVTAPETIGKVVRFTIRAGKRPRVGS
jgi:hypothetical protein